MALVPGRPVKVSAGPLALGGFGEMSMRCSPRGPGAWSGMQEGLDGAAFVHGSVTLRGFGQRQLEVEDPARVDLPAHDEIDQIGQEAAYRGGAAVQVDVAEEQFLARETGNSRRIGSRNGQRRTTGPRSGPRFTYRGGGPA